MNAPPTLQQEGTDQRLMWAAALALVVLYAVLTWLERVPAVTTRNDDAVYILLSREVARFTYAQSWLLDAPVHALYPPGYPTWLALLRLTFGEHLGVFVAGNVLLVSTGLLLVFDVLRRHWPPVVGIVFLGLSAGSPMVHDAGARILSEGPYFFLTALTLWLAIVRPKGAPWIGMTIVAAITASLTRSIGLTLVLALGCCWLIQGHRKRVVFLGAAALVFVGSWLLWTIVAPEKFIGANYVAEMVREPTGPIQTIWQRIIHHSISYWTEGVPYSLPLVTIQGTRIDNLIWLLVTTVLAILGFARLWKTWCVAAIYLVGYASLLLIWPWVNNRLLIPTMPFLIVLFLAGVGSPWIRGRWRQAQNALVGVFVLGVLGGIVQQGGPQLKKRLACDRQEALTAPGCFNDDQRSFFAGAIWVKENLPTDVVVVSPKEGTFAYYSERRILHAKLIQASDRASYLDAMAEVGVDYLLLDRIHPMSRRRMGPSLLSVCDQLEVAASFPPRTYLLKRADTDEDAPASGQESACAALRHFNENLEPDPTTPSWW